MAVVLDDLPPLMWHAELGKGLIDVWTDSHHRGVQLHDLREAVDQWTGRYEQHAWLRQLDADGHPRRWRTPCCETIARLDGTPFPSTAKLVGRWARGRVRQAASAELTYCAEVVAATYEAMGLLGTDRPTNYYDPGKFWSGDDLELLLGARLGNEIAVLTGGSGPRRPRAGPPVDHAGSSTPAAPARRATTSAGSPHGCPHRRRSRRRRSVGGRHRGEVRGRTGRSLGTCL